jgi:hypothetical protein
MPNQGGFSLASKEEFSKSLTSVIGAFGKEGEGWKISDAQARRFRIPDALRAVFSAMGPGAARAFLDGVNARWLYSDEAHNCGFNPLPHDVVPGVGRHTSADGEFYAEQTRDDRLAYYIERWGGQELGELSKLGGALWKIFTAPRRKEDPQTIAAEMLQDKRGRISVQTTLGLPAPQRNSDGVAWSNFMYWLDLQQDDLFREAGKIYAARYANEFPNWTIAKRTESQEIEVHGHVWKVANA